MPSLALRRAFDDLAHRMEAGHDPDWRPSLLGPDDMRGEAEAFSAAVYRARHGVELREFMPWLLTFRERHGALLAVVGLRPALDSQLFVEQYLDESADRAMSAALNRPIDRRSMIEVGGLAAQRPGEARRLILCLTRGLDAAGFRWVLFTATRQLRNAFDRLGLLTTALAPARRERLAPAVTDWGRYYDSQPTVVCGDIAAGAAFLAAGESDHRLARRRARAGDPIAEGAP